MLENKIRIISAGAGSGKTHRLTEELADLLQDADSGILPEGIVATTFTRKAAAELVERLRQSLFKKQRGQEAEKLSAGLIGTVNSISGILLKQIAFEAGISPQLEVVADEDQQVIFNKALAELVDNDKVSELEDICERLESRNWKEQLKGIVDAARSNNCSKNDLPGFAKKSVLALMKYVPTKSTSSASKLDKSLFDAITTAIKNIRKNTADTTAGTKKYLEFLEGIDVRLKGGQLLSWKEWVDLATSKPTKASESLTDSVRNAAAVHATHPRFHDDIDNYITTLFSLASDLIEHYQEYKKERGLMDFVDQESQLLKALDSEDVRERLSESLDLLLVDEFQDTSPIQLALFLKLTDVVKKSIWVQEAPIIFDKPANVERNATAGDIAVLCRANDDCRDIASLLAARGVRVAIGRPGLIETPEGKLVLACLRYFMNAYDTLANAEIQVLTSSDPKPEAWLADRLEWLSSGGKSHEWGSSHKTLVILKELAQRAIDFSPSEALDEIIEAIDLRRVIMGWGECERRLGNLENIREMVRAYEDSCRRQMSAATVSGFLLWLSDLSDAGKDNQAEGHGTEAVSLLTCHSSKGLEWPIVVVATLDAGIRERVWGVVVNDDRTSVPLNDPLADRWIRLWPWPYGKKSKDTGLKEKLQGSDIMNRAFANAEAEELRLLYVTLTRARDYLVLCLNNKGVPWLDLALLKAKLALPPLDGEKTAVCEWGDKGTKIKFQVQISKEAASLPLAADAGKWLSERVGGKSYPPARVNPSSMELPDGITVSVRKPIVTGKLITLSGKPSYEYLGNAIHGFIAVDFDGKSPQADRIALLDGLLSRHEVTGVVPTTEVLANCDGFYKFAEGLSPTRVYTEWPLQMKFGNQLLVGTADMLLDTPAGWVVIDHKTFPGPQSQWVQEAEGYAGQLKAYSDALKLATGKAVAALYIHFAIGGGVVQVAF